jgi:hypothetical protein
LEQSLKSIAPHLITARHPTRFNWGEFSDGCYNLGQSIALPLCPMTQQPTYGPHNPHPLSQIMADLGRFAIHTSRKRLIELQRTLHKDGKPYRARKDRSLKTISDAAYQYPAPGKYIACVKVVDTFGCDTSITVEVEV